MATNFFTGFPGFLASGLLPRVLRQAPADDAVCLVQTTFARLARERVAALVAGEPALDGRIRLVEGDITLPDLGLGAARDALARDTRRIYHLAAIYDLAVRRELAERVNVEGTRHVLDFASACPAPPRLEYVSTCYVSGTHEGRFTEGQLDVGQAFHNAYEETKYRAEVLVRDAIARGLPAAIYRPAIVVGDSRTGATQKLDGPYPTILWLLRQPRVAVLPIPRGAAATELNVVPCDFVLDAIAALGHRGESAGKTFHLADPQPLKLPEMLRVLGVETGRRIVTVPVPFGVARAALRLLGTSRLAPMSASMLDYTVHRARYDTAATTGALEGTGIACPRFSDYASRLIAGATSCSLHECAPQETARASPAEDNPANNKIEPH